jgi:hypothetical protein
MNFAPVSLAAFIGMFFVGIGTVFARDTKSFYDQGYNAAKKEIEWNTLQLKENQLTDKEKKKMVELDKEMEKDFRYQTIEVSIAQNSSDLSKKEQFKSFKEFYKGRHAALKTASYSKSLPARGLHYYDELLKLETELSYVMANAHDLLAAIIKMQEVLDAWITRLMKSVGNTWVIDEDSKGNLYRLGQKYANEVIKLKKEGLLQRKDTTAPMGFEIRRDLEAVCMNEPAVLNSKLAFRKILSSGMKDSLDKFNIREFVKQHGLTRSESQRILADYEIDLFDCNAACQAKSIDEYAHRRSFIACYECRKFGLIDAEKQLQAASNQAAKKV